MSYTVLDSEKIFDKFDKIMTAQERSIYSLANDSGVTCGAIYKWRKSKTMPTLKMLDSICKVLNVSVASLLSSHDDPTEIDESEKELLELWNGIDCDTKTAVVLLLKSLQRCR